jgi:preprotein translocase subunit YajC
MILFGIIFYFLLIRPQQKRAKEQRLMLEKLKSGDRVITSGGLIGEVITVKERSVTLRSADAKFEVTKDSVVAITEPKAADSQS